jgi:nucleoside-diphosphate-sugar epimerase
MKVNVDGTINVFNEAVRSGAANFIFMSTIMALGPQGKENSPMTEDMKPNPTEDYGRSKLECERFLEKESKDKDISIVALRPPVLYGGGMNVNSSAMRTFEAIRKGNMPLVGNGKTILNMLYVGNLSHAVVMSLNAGPGFSIYHVNEGPYTQKKVIDTVSRVLGIKKGYKKYPKPLLWLLTLVSEITSPLFKGPPPISWTKYRALTTDSWATDFSKIKSELGYKPIVSFEEGIRETGHYYGW